MIGCAAHQEVTIRSVPEGAQISVNGVPYGPAPVKARLITDAFMGVGRTPYDVVATKAGYHEKKVTLTSNAFMFNDARPYPDPVVITLDGQAAPIRVPVVVSREPAPVHHEPPPARRATPQPQPKRESWR